MNSQPTSCIIVGNNVHTMSNATTLAKQRNKVISAITPIRRGERGPEDKFKHKSGYPTHWIQCASYTMGRHMRSHGHTSLIPKGRNTDKNAQPHQSDGRLRSCAALRRIPRNPRKYQKQPYWPTHIQTIVSPPLIRLLSPAQPSKRAK